MALQARSFLETALPEPFPKMVLISKGALLLNLRQTCQVLKDVSASRFMGAACDS